MCLPTARFPSGGREDTASSADTRLSFSAAQKMPAYQAAAIFMGDGYSRIVTAADFQGGPRCHGKVLAEHHASGCFR